MSRRLLPAEPDELSSPLGRYSIHQAIAVGEVTSVHIGLLEGAEGFRKTVAVKRPSPVSFTSLPRSPTHEARRALVHHYNVVSVIDLGRWKNGPFLVMEYVLGETVAGCWGFAAARSRSRGDRRRRCVRCGPRGRGRGRRADQDRSPKRLPRTSWSASMAARVIDFGSSFAADSAGFRTGSDGRAGRASRRPKKLRRAARRDRPTRRSTPRRRSVELVAGMRPSGIRGHQAFLSRPTRRSPASAFTWRSPGFDAVMEQALSWSPASVESAAFRRRTRGRRPEQSNRGHGPSEHVRCEVAVQRKLPARWARRTDAFRRRLRPRGGSSSTARCRSHARNRPHRRCRRLRGALRFDSVS